MSLYREKVREIKIKKSFTKIHCYVYIPTIHSCCYYCYRAESQYNSLNCIISLEEFKISQSIFCDLPIYTTTNFWRQFHRKLSWWTDQNIRWLLCSGSAAQNRRVRAQTLLYMYRYLNLTIIIYYYMKSSSVGRNWATAGKIKSADAAGAVGW